MSLYHTTIKFQIGVHIFKGDSNAGFIPNFLKLEFKGCKALLIVYGDSGKDFLSTMNITSVCPMLQKVRIFLYYFSFYTTYI